MIKKGDIVRITKEWLSPKENPNTLYIVVGVLEKNKYNPYTDYYISPVVCDMFIRPQSRVREGMIYKYADFESEIKPYIEKAEPTQTELEKILNI